MDDPTDNYVYTCLKYDFQVHEALASTKPPFDNYFNISRAIYIHPKMYPLNLSISGCILPTPLLIWRR